jgi:hypothetical protein
MIKIEVTETGYITIDVPSDDATLLRRFPYASGTDFFALALARTIVGGTGPLKRMSFRKRTGLPNMGWTATFIDSDRQTAYVAANTASHSAVELTGGSIPAHVPGAYPRLSCCGGTIEVVKS